MGRQMKEKGEKNQRRCRWGSRRMVSRCFKRS
jgi:hypothetical protein